MPSIEIVAIGVQGVGEALGLLAIGGEGEDVGRDLEEEARRLVEYLAPEIEDEGRADEDEAAPPSTRPS